ncbi:Excinuclease ABC subunit C [Sulfurivirga caldicuralii]|uniref:UvrABC system protein C n=1 Tax=Sulfurivirga caldicuralii TaxID=364032 RepID=A0A1N6E205_9GAMM|nr:excinuclease ABC subunit UvrC [Sulfurivirga caldicuralii]SIN76997.1 Excinuclease ABC subunit C [Sulfurivirga caldicuralii]
MSFDIQAFLKTLPERPGVYRMLNADGQIIYVGKARNLKRRVSSYFQKQHDSPKTARLVSQIASIEVTLTETEAEALLLESTLIKRHNPRYNVLFRDDKSYPYIYVNTKDRYPGLYFHRGAKRKKGAYFGPFPDAGAVYQTLHALQKIFPVRQCSDSVFRHRSRPCLQYQIGRCSGPCVGLVSDEEYAEDVRNTLLFLEGKSFEVIEYLGEQMQQAALALEFERAAQLRDRIAALRAIQSQYLINQQAGELDVIGLAGQGDQYAVVLMRYQGGTLWGSQTFYPKAAEASPKEVLEAFLGQYYAERTRPRTILLPFDLAEKSWFEKVGDPPHPRLGVARTRTEKELIKLAETNAQAALRQHLTQKATQEQKLAAVQAVLALPRPPQVMECFDISHTQGQETVGSCVCFRDGVPDKSRYRRYNVEGITPGDDYAAMEQVLRRHYGRLRAQPEQLPDLIVIDGGKGQLNRALAVLKDLDLDHLPLVSVAKGEGRKVGLEVLHTPYEEAGIDLPPEEPALHLINFLRDEAHRFAITGHRGRRQKRQLGTRLEEIEGVGPKLRQRLLTHFGGLRQLQDASVSELAKVKGVSQRLAQRIYDHFHGEIE